jgi:lysophospholipase L1-like esterase
VSRKSRTYLGYTAAVCFSFSLGVFVQHRWPIGRWGDDASSRSHVASVTPDQLAKLPANRRLILLCIGQSNAANYGSSRRAAGARVYAFANAKLHVATDPLPGGDGYGGSIWTRLGPRLVESGRFDAIVFAVAAKGSTRATDWAPKGSCHLQLVQTLNELQSSGLPVDVVLWQQGEEEAREPTASEDDYIEAVKAVAATCHRYFPRAPVMIAQATFGELVNEQIRRAQQRLAEEPGFAVGPDIDRYGLDFRHDGIHLNDAGLDAAASAWFDKLSKILSRPSS